MLSLFAWRTPAPRRGRHRAPRRGGGRNRPAAAATVLLLAGAGVAVLAVSRDSSHPTPVNASARPAGPPPGRSGPGGGPGTLRNRVVPLQLRVPSVGIRTPMVSLGIDRAGRLQAPGDPDIAGWYAGSSTPGELGPAVVAGHVDSATGPAVFYRLGSLRSGASVEVLRSDGRTARFRVRAVERYPKADFPTDRVYGPTPERGLRLITCGGSYDHVARSYVDNVVVYAVAR